MDFGEYLAKKKVDGKAFQNAEPARFEEWRTLFDQISEQSFTSQKLYLINAVRRKYTLKEDQPAVKSDTATPAKPKPVIKPRPKFN